MKEFLTTTPSGEWGDLEDFDMDKYGGHPQNDSDWHMHVGNVLLDPSFNDCVVGYALDGTPIIGGLESVVYNELGDVSYNGAKSGWRRRTDDEYTASYARKGNGVYHYDYKFDASGASGDGNLDQFNGGYSYIDGNYQYSYFLTSEYPTFPRNLRGVISNIDLTDETTINVYVKVVDPDESPYYSLHKDISGQINYNLDISGSNTYIFHRINSGHPFNVTTTNPSGVSELADLGTTGLTIDLSSNPANGGTNGINNVGDTLTVTVNSDSINETN